MVIGRPRNYSELASLVGAYPRVKAVGVGHSWWAEQFCAGTDERSINIVMTELQDTLPAFEGKPESTIFLDEAARSVTVKAGVSQRTLLKYLAKWVACCTVACCSAQCCAVVHSAVRADCSLLQNAPLCCGLRCDAVSAQ